MKTSFQVTKLGRLLKSTISNALFHNLTDHLVPRPLTALLNRGTKYIPPTKPPKPRDINTAFYSFTNDLNRKLFFHSRPENTDTSRYVPQLYAKADIEWQPPYIYPSAVQYAETTNLRLLTSYREAFEKYSPTNCFDTIAAEAYLRNNPQLKVVNSDKNLGLCLITKDKYIRLVMKHLGDEDTYTYIGPLDQWTWPPILLNAQQQLNQLALQLPLGVKYLQRFLEKNKDPRLPMFHCLIKIHKETLSGRPIAGAHSSISTEISSLLSYILREKVVKGMPHILRDSQHLIAQAELIPLDQNDIIVTFDIVSLYPSIRQEQFLAMFERLTLELGETKDWCRKASSFIFQTAFATFNNTVYRQVNGITMGTNAAVEMANIYIAYLIEYNLIFKQKQHLMKLWRRFIDDAFMIWRGTEEQLHDFHALLNSIEPSIQWTIKYSKEGVEFLDVFAHRHNNQLHFRTYQKPLNKFSYLPHDSTHPDHCKSGFVRGELLRYVRTNTRETDFTTMKHRLYARLLFRGYPRPYLNRIFRTVRHADRPKILMPKEEPVTQQVFLKVKYHPLLENLELGKVLRKYWSGLPFKDSFKPVISFRKQRNVAALLTSSALIKWPT